MGSEFYFYIGAYLEIEADGIKKPSYQQVCPNGHGSYPYEFCPRCGKKTVKEELIYAATLEDLYDGGDLWSPPVDGKLIALGNVTKKLPDHVDFPSNRSYAEDMPDTSKYMENFMTNYAADIAQIKTRASSVKVKFGLVGYWY